MNGKKRLFLLIFIVIVVALAMVLTTACQPSKTEKQTPDAADGGDGTPSQPVEVASISVKNKSGAVMAAHTEAAAREAIDVEALDTAGATALVTDYTVELGDLSEDRQTIELIVRYGDKEERLSVSYVGPVGIEAEYAEDESIDLFTAASEVGVTVYAVYADGRRQQIDPEEVSATLDTQSAGEKDYLADFQGFTATTKVNVEDFYGVLRPIHNVLIKEDDTGMALRVSGDVDIGGIDESFERRVFFYITDGAPEVMLSDGEDNVLASYKHGKTSYNGFGMDVSLYQGMIDALLNTAFAGGAATIDNVLMETKDVFTILNENFDVIKYGIGRYLNAKGYGSYDFDAYSRGGEYYFTINSKPLIPVATFLFSDAFDELTSGFDIDVADLLGVRREENVSDLELTLRFLDDKYMDGAVADGRVTVILKLVVADYGIGGEIFFVNIADEKIYLRLETELAFGNPIMREIPEITETHDIVIDVPFSLPQKNIELNTHVVFHTADMFSAPLKNYITATVDVNGTEQAIKLVVNDGYVYMDISGLEEPSHYNYTYFLQYQEDDEYFTISQKILELIIDIMENGFEEEENYDDFCECGILPAPPQAYNQVNYLPIGSTIDDLREILYVYGIDVDGNEIPVKNYKIRGFDSSRAQRVRVYVTFGEFEASMEVTIYDPAQARPLGSEFISYERWYFAEQGTNISDVKFYGSESWTDGKNTWSVGIEFTPEGANIPASGILEAGAYDVTLRYKEAALYSTLYVYDPDHLIALETFITHEAIVYTPYEEDTLEEAVRNSYSVLVFWNNGQMTEEKGYTISGLGSENGRSYFTVGYGGKEYNITLYLEKRVTAGVKAALSGDVLVDMTEEELREILTVTVIYNDGKKKEIDDYTIEHFNPDREGEVTFNVFYDGIRIRVNAKVREKSIFDKLPEPEDILSALRFTVDTDQDPINLIKSIVNSVIDIYDANKGILDKAVQIYDEEGKKRIVACVSDVSLEEEGDLLAFLNKFIGIPKEEGGFDDIDGQALFDLLPGFLGDYSFNKLYHGLINECGFTLEELMTDLYATLIASDDENGFDISLALSGDPDPEKMDEEGYLSIGLGVHSAQKDEQNDIVVSPEMIASANSNVNWEILYVALTFNLVHKLF